jgi:hypothetical protein
MEDGKSPLDHMMAEFAARTKKTAKKIKRAMAGRPPKKAKASAGRKAVGTHKSQERAEENDKATPLMRPGPRRMGAMLGNKWSRLPI